MAQSFHWHAINYDVKKIHDLSGKFSIHCKPETDLWEKPPHTHSETAPIVYTAIKKSEFVSAKISVSGNWRYRYDQGGLCMLINTSDRKRWVKTGIEYYQDKPYISSVGNDQWSDWSLRPSLDESSPATIEITPFDGALWIYLVDSDGSKVPMREVAWWEAIPDDTELWVGPYAAKPAEGKEQLIVHFEKLEIKTK